MKNEILIDFKTIKQINNMKIKFNKLYGKWTVYTPDGRGLEEFDTIEDAIEWAKITKDFIVRKNK